MPGTGWTGSCSCSPASPMLTGHTGSSLVPGTRFRAGEYRVHELINFIDTKANCRHLKKLTCKGSFAAGVSKEFVDWRFSFVNCCPSNIISGSTPPPPSPSSNPSLWELGYCTHIYCTVCGGGGGGDGVLNLSQINTCRKVLLQVNFFR